MAHGYATEEFEVTEGRLQDSKQGRGTITDDWYQQNVWECTDPRSTSTTRSATQTAKMLENSIRACEARSTESRPRSTHEQA
jgi:hypothetical protein